MCFVTIVLLTCETIGYVYTRPNRCIYGNTTQVTVYNSTSSQHFCVVRWYCKKNGALSLLGSHKIFQFTKSWNFFFLTKKRHTVSLTVSMVSITLILCSIRSPGVIICEHVQARSSDSKFISTGRVVQVGTVDHRDVCVVEWVGTTYMSCIAIVAVESICCKK